MNPMFSRTLKALCVFAAVALLSACGSSTTVDPFKPTRVIGLGDGYNDIRTAAGGQAPTVREGLATGSSVVEQVAASFGVSNVVSYASAGQKIGDLASQIASVGGFTSGDLVVITVGTFDVKEGTNVDTAKQALMEQIQALLDAGAKHVLVMPVLDVSRTPWGRAHSFSTTATNTFNEAILGAVSKSFGGRSPNPVIYANTSGVTSFFLTVTTLTAYSPFTDTGYDGTVAGTPPACGDAEAFVGCDAPVTGNTTNTNYSTMLFADGIHLTPAGNRWVAGYLYGSTGQGWR